MAAWPRDARTADRQLGRRAGEDGCTHIRRQCPNGRIGTVWSTLRYLMGIRAEDACVRRQSMRIRIGIGLASALVVVATAATVASVTTRASATTATAARGGPATASAATASAATASAAATTRIENVPAFGHVFLIIGENTTYSHLT